MAEELWLVEMELTCDSTDPNVISEFKKRWTDDLKEEWSILIYWSELEYLHEQINQQIFDDCHKLIDDDMKRTSVSISAFGESDWNVVNGDEHESDHKLEIPVMFTNVPNDIWTFAVGGSRFKIGVKCYFWSALVKWTSRKPKYMSR